MENLMIRKETERDYAAVENLTREAFWTVNVPGYDEHYLVHTMRCHEDFIPELAFVLERNGEIIGNVMYTRAALVDESGFCKPILTFGPLSILPAYQRRGYGRLLLEHSFRCAEELGYAWTIPPPNAVKIYRFRLINPYFALFAPNKA